MMKVALLLFALVAVALAGKRHFPEYTVPLPSAEGWELDHSSIFFQHEPEVRLVVALKQRNVEKLDALFWKVSDPTHKEYAEYLSLSEVRDLVAPLPSQVAKVTDWLEGADLKYEVTESRDLIILKGTPRVFSDLFETKMLRWVHAGGAVAFKSVFPYSVPAELADVIDFVTGIHHFPTLEKKSIFSTAAQLIGPKDLRTRYNVTGTGSTAAGQAVAEFQGQYYSPSDLKQFFQQFVPYSQNNTVQKVVGPNSPDQPGVEAELDIQYIKGVTPDAPTWFYSQSSFDFWSDLTAWIAAINNEQNPPLVHSVSYGEQREHQQTSAYKDRLNTEFQKLGVRGISIIFASGDSGCGCFMCVRYEPSFPATCPSVTSVGATRFLSGPPVLPSTEEGAVEAFGSGGGFSWHFDMPSYQTGAVDQYVNENKNLPSGIHWNKKGRGTPDVAALGIGFSVVVDGRVESVGGTSASTPTFAGIVTQLNDAQLKAGKKPLGFLNPWIYQTAKADSSAFFDVTVGSNPDGCCRQGFECDKGWDPVTGVGTPNFPSLVKNLP